MRSKVISAAAVTLISLLFAGLSHAQLVVSQTGSAPEMKLWDLRDPTATPRVLYTGMEIQSLVAGLDVDNVTPVLYWVKGNSPRTLHKAPLTAVGLLTPTPAGGLGTLPGSTSGLAWDSGTFPGELLGNRNGGTPQGFGQINRTNAAWTLSHERGTMLGLTYDPVADAYYTLHGNTYRTNGAGTADGRSGGLPTGPGIYRVTKPLSTATLTKVADVPNWNLLNAPSLGVINLAYGNGRLFIISSTSINNGGPQAVNVLNLAGGVYESNPPGISFSIYDSSQGGVAWVPGLITPPSGTDLALSAGASSDCTVPVGGTLTYSVHVENYGSDASAPTTFVVTLPDPSMATFLSSTPMPSSVNGNQLTYAVEALPAFGVGAYADVVIRLTAASAGGTASLSASLSGSDINPANDTAEASVSIQPLGPTTASIRAVLASRSITDSARSLVPDGSGDTIKYFGLSLLASGNESWWISSLTSHRQPGSLQDVYVRGGVSVPSSVMARFGSTLTGQGPILTLGAADVNSQGQVMFGGTDSAPAASNAFLARTDGQFVTVLAREGDSLTGGPVGAVAGTSLGSINAIDDGSATSITGTGTSQYFLRDRAITKVVSSFTPVGANGPITTQGVMRSDSTATNTLYVARTTPTGGEPPQNVLVYNDSVVLRDGQPALPGDASPVVFDTTSTYPPRLADNGYWGQRIVDGVVFGHGMNVIRVVRNGDPIVPGSGEFWAREAGTFERMNFIVDGEGNYVVLGSTSGPPLSNFAAVYNGTTVIARENDPIDINGDGLFENEGFIINFVGASYSIALYDNALLTPVSVRNAAAALCQSNQAEVGEALVMIPLPLPQHVHCCRGTTCTMVAPSSCTGTSDGTTATSMASCGSGASVTGCCYADYTKTSGVNIDDIFVYLNAWFASSPYTRFNGDGTAPPTIDDIFVYLNAWFAGCS